ncbi:MAG: hypothetical protein HC819_07980 [Cyclobacteriaceae bacterium]|nr:hypothetical protein [Cyclobacteriaceae bacterium]
MPIKPLRHWWENRIIWLIAALLSAVILLFMFIKVLIKRRAGTKTGIKTEISPSAKSEPTGQARCLSQDKNLIKLFGAFQVLNKAGEDITHEFTPKIKQLFLAILLHSAKSKSGITTEELTEIVWPEQTFQSAKNSRGVSIRKLRVILESLDHIEILFQRDRWTVFLSENVFCDYFECIRMLENPQFNSMDYFFQLFRLVEDGQIVKNENYEWMDDIKGYVDYRVIDILLKYIGLLDHVEHAGLILKIIDRIHISDPVNEKAFELKVKILLAQDNHHFARYCHETFSKNFEDFYGQAYQKSFEEVASAVRS